jgi:hypothetical protein
MAQETCQPQSLCGRDGEEIPSSAAAETPVIQSAVSHYTDWAHGSYMNIEEFI